MSEASIVFKSSLHGIVSVHVPCSPTTIPYVPRSSGSGWIYGIIDERIIVVTCAHLILENEGVAPVVKPMFPISCSVSDAIEKGCNKKQNIAVSLGLLGMDITADIAVLFSYKPEEVNSVNPFGFNFSSRNNFLPFGDSINTSLGTSVYIISNEYGTGLSMSSGICTDNSVVYSPENPLYTNFLEQFISSVDAASGSSGSAVLVYNNQTQKGEVVGMVAWRKTTGGNYVGGPNQRTMEASINKLLSLNPICKINITDDSIYPYVDFVGKTGCGFLGIGSYSSVDDFQAQYLVKTYPKYAALPESNKLIGVRILSITDSAKYPLVIPNSRIQNAKNMKNGQRSGLKIDDIILKLNGVEVGYYDTLENINFSSYYNINIKSLVEIIRPSTGEYMIYKITPDEYPEGLDFVSTDNSFKLIGVTTNYNLGLFLTQDDLLIKIIEDVYISTPVEGTTRTTGNVLNGIRCLILESGTYDLSTIINLNIAKQLDVKIYQYSNIAPTVTINTIITSGTLLVSGTTGQLIEYKDIIVNSDNSQQTLEPPYLNNIFTFIYIFIYSDNENYSILTSSNLSVVKK